MKKICFLLVAVIMSLTLCSCRGAVPFDYTITKWECDNFELYVKELGKGYFVYKDIDQKTTIFDADFQYSSVLYIYKHRESTDQEVEIIARYNPVGLINNSKRSDFSLSHITDKSYAEVFPERIRLRKVEDITLDDFEYEFFGVTTAEWNEIT